MVFIFCSIDLCPLRNSSFSFKLKQICIRSCLIHLVVLYMMAYPTPSFDFEASSFIFFIPFLIKKKKKRAYRAETLVSIYVERRTISSKAKSKAMESTRSSRFVAHRFHFHFRPSRVGHQNKFPPSPGVLESAGTSIEQNCNTRYYRTVLHLDFVAPPFLSPFSFSQTPALSRAPFQPGFRRSTVGRCFLGGFQTKQVQQANPESDSILQRIESTSCSHSSSVIDGFPSEER